MPSLLEMAKALITKFVELAPVKSVPVTFALVKTASVSLALVRLAPFRSAPIDLNLRWFADDGVKSTPLRLILVSLAPVILMTPAREAPVRFTPDRLANDRSAPVRSTLSGLRSRD